MNHRRFAIVLLAAMAFGTTANEDSDTAVNPLLQMFQHDQKAADAELAAANLIIESLNNVITQQKTSIANYKTEMSNRLHQFSDVFAQLQSEKKKVADRGIQYGNLEQNCTEMRSEHERLMQALVGELRQQVAFYKSLQDGAADLELATENSFKAYEECADNLTYYMQLSAQQAQQIDALNQQVITTQTDLNKCYSDSAADKAYSDDQIGKCNGTVKQKDQAIESLDKAHTDCITLSSTLKSENDACRVELNRSNAECHSYSQALNVSDVSHAGCTASLHNCSRIHNRTAEDLLVATNSLQECQALGKLKDDVNSELQRNQTRLLSDLGKCDRDKLGCERQLDGAKSDLDRCRNQTAECQKKVAVLSDVAVVSKNHEEEKEKCLGSILKLKQHFTKSIVLKDCLEWKNAGFDSGEYTVDPDGPAYGVEPFKVFCDFSDGSAVTKVRHATTSLMTNKDGPLKCKRLPQRGSREKYGSKEKHGSTEKHGRKGRKHHSKHASNEDDTRPVELCYSVDIQYSQSEKQLNALKANSKNCTQKISWECFEQTQLILYTPTSYWGKSVVPTTFDPSGDLECDCSKQVSCKGADLGCNCYADNPEWLHDDITLDTEDVPVWSIGLGDLRSQNQKGRFAVGEMICV